jgi:LAS seventeen-binding protein 5
VTQDKSKVLKETDNPFHDSEDEAEAAAKSQPPPAAASSSQVPVTYPQPTQTVQSFSHTKSSSRSGSSFFGSSKDKDKKKDKHKKKSRPFNLEAEKASMKVAVAESSIAATNLMNSLQSINRETERISENVQAVQRFETCKKLRRKIVRYVSHILLQHDATCESNKSRSIMSKTNSGSVASSTPTMSSYLLS